MSDHEESDNSYDEYEQDDMLEDVVQMQSISSIKNYKIMNYAELNEEMDKISGEVSSIIELPKVVTRTLLHCFKWNKESLIEKFYDAPDLERYGIINPTMNPSNSRGNHSKSKKKGKHFCLVCDAEKNLKSIDCAHTFCMDCWQQYLKTKVVNDGTSRILCPASKCSIFVPDEAIVHLITEPNTKRMFLKLMTNDFVKENQNMTFCPAINCDLACKADSPGCQLVKCACNYVYCFACSEPWHSPISCELLVLWLRQCNSDKETLNWIVAYTKDCPKCKSTIEKNGGCNHMHCKSCNHDFCWLCFQPWSNHDFNNCNRFDTEHDKKVSSTRDALERYLHYYSRYHNHENSLQLEKKLYTNLEKKALMFQEVQGVPFSETRFLLHSVDILGECRRILMYTYAFAFYLKKNNITHILEDNQQDLELATEALSDILENQLSEETNFMEMRQEVLDKTKYLRARKECLIEHCQEGTEHDEWKFTIDIDIGTIPPY